MKRVLLFSVTLLTVVSCQSQKKLAKAVDSEKEQYQLDNRKKRDTARVIVDSILYGKQEVKLDSTLTQRLLSKLGEKEKDWRIEWIIPLIVSAIFGASAYFFSLKTIRRDKRYRNLEFIAEVDKLLIEHPELWAYEDKKRDEYESKIKILTPAKINITGIEKILINGNNSINITTSNQKDVLIVHNSGKQETILKGSNTQIPIVPDEEITIQGEADLSFSASGSIILQSLDDKLLDEKLNAFCYYKLNNFELALKDSSDKRTRKSWEEYLKYIYDKSGRFKNIIGEVKGDNRAIYNETFVRKIEKILK